MDCLNTFRGRIAALPHLADQIDAILGTSGSGRVKDVGSNLDWSSEVEAADAKKAEGASLTTLRTPKPPLATGNVA
jgi:hypothetical protein